jgi:alanyl-tRNA synthetase
MHETAAELRRSFLQFFRDRGHRQVASSPLIPVGDPTLLFTTAGMVQFKPLYGSPDPEFSRAASVQKCLRATDIDQVGRTIRHHTFLEMLGNFSFGDYFKSEAIAWAWEYVRQVVVLDRQHIWVSVHESDDEAARIWERETDLLPGRIVRLGNKDNFWGPAGSTGACGPSSELYWDLGPGADPGGLEGALGTSDRYLEFWNLVFPQFNQDATGVRTPLARPGIDTGMGLERLCMIVQEVGSTYETDLFRPIIARILELAGLPGAAGKEHELAIRIIADHSRALAFAIADGVVPGNEGRGYVVRRILRRAARRGRALGLTAPFLHRVTETVIETFRDTYAELKRMEEAIDRVTLAEEERFARTLDAGMERFAAIVAENSARGVDAGGKEGGGVITGAQAFQLYDTYGFPIDLTEEMAAEHGLRTDRPGFEAAMAEQRERARRTHRFRAATASGEGGAWTVISDGPDSEFRGYETLALEAKVRRFRSADDGTVEIVLDETPFYAEAGGQVGDQGLIEAEGLAVLVTDTVGEAGNAEEGETWTAARTHVHRGRFLRGGPRELTLAGGQVTARVDPERRAAIMRNHTATHLLHAALKEVLGEHVQQSGSLVAPDRLRFDFTHFAALTSEQVAAIEDRVNREILRNTPVEVREEPYDQARGRGAVALFGEKYGREVRTIGVPGFSLELCGGTHCRGTGDIGLFKIVSESAIGAGMRRLEAVTGLGSLAHLSQIEERLGEVGKLLGVGGGQVVERLRALLKENADLRQKLKSTAGGGLDRLVEDALAAAEDSDGRRFVATRIDVDSVELLRRAGDLMRDRLRSGAGVLAASIGGKVSLLAVVTDDLVQRGELRADELIREVAAAAGGSGGGKPHQAMGGGDPGRIEEALDRARAMLRERLRAATRS